MAFGRDAGECCGSMVGLSDTLRVCAEAEESLITGLGQGVWKCKGLEKVQR